MRLIIYFFLILIIEITLMLKSLLIGIDDVILKSIEVETLFSLEEGQRIALHEYLQPYKMFEERV